MSLRFLQLFVNSLRQSLPRPSNLVKSGLQTRFVSAMSAVEVDEASSDLVQDKNRTRYKRRFLKRQWETNEVDKAKEIGESDEKKPFERIKRKKVAMMLGYCGVDYYGMQRNPGVPTIEEELLKALYDAKYISQEDFNNPQNAQFQRSSRTDKGVSAVRQVVSLKLPLEVNIDEINSRLPSSIKVFAIKRATNKFNSKSKCNARTYSYTLPTYVFDPSLTTQEERKNYRASAETITKVNEVLGVYSGTKSYHNFTEKKHFQDPSALRYMMSFKLERVFIESEVEFAELLVKGQSFMLHQIRKMVGLMLAVVRGLVDPGVMERVFAKDKVMIPTAPGLGLVLDKVHYESYDAKFKSSHESLSWETEEESIEKFKREHIFPSIIKGEIEGNSMGLWLEKIKRHSFEPSDDNGNGDECEIGGGDDDDDDSKVTNKIGDDNETTADSKVMKTVEETDVVDSIDDEKSEKLDVQQSDVRSDEKSEILDVPDSVSSVSDEIKSNDK